MFEQETDWFCAENGIPNNVEVLAFQKQDDLLEWIFFHKNFYVRKLFNYYFPAYSTMYETSPIGGACADLRIYGEPKVVAILNMQSINKHRNFSLYTVLFHELVHYRQYQQRHLRASHESGDYRIEWEGPAVPSNWALPKWEFDAYMEQNDWATKWLTQKNKLNTSKLNTIPTQVEPPWTDWRQNMESLQGPLLESLSQWESTRRPNGLINWDCL